MDFDEIDEILDFEVGEGHSAVIADPVDPYHATIRATPFASASSSQSRAPQV